jgi:hypothetical protein
MGSNWWLLVVHEDACSAFIEGDAVTWPTQALMEVGMCATILTETFVLKLALAFFVHLLQSVGRSLAHRSSNHRIWVVCPLAISPSRV